MLKDQFDCPVSTSNSEVVTFLNSFSNEFIRLDQNMGQTLKLAVDQHPNEPLLNIFASIFHLFALAEESLKLANHELDEASLRLDFANDREKSLFSAAWHWVTHQLSETLKRFEWHCYKWPQDLTAIKMTEFIFFCKGQKYEAHWFLRLTTHCYQQHKDNPYFLSIHAFALALGKKYAESLEIAQRSLDIDEKNPWAHHALAHIYLNTGEINKGITVLEHFSSSWENSHSFIRSHNLWLLALLYLENLDFEKVANIYHRANWENECHLVSEQIDVIALLWRLDFEGVNNNDEWELIAKTVESNAHFGTMPFVTAHLCYALKRGKREQALNDALKKIEAFANEQFKEDRFVWKEIGLPLIRGSLAFGENDFEHALQYLSPIMDKVDAVGGSDAQVALFYKMYIKCLLGAQRGLEAEQQLHKFTQGRNMTKLELKWLAQCQESARL